MSITLTAVLFAGGLSRRMGMDKATLPTGEGPLWARQIGVLNKLNPAALWCSARSRPEWLPLEMEVVLDEPPSRGPLSGLTAVLEVVGTSHLLALAVDMPRMTTDHLAKLRMLASPGRGVIPLIGDQFEPLCAVYPVEVAEMARSALSAGHYSMQRLVGTLEGRKLLHRYPVLTEEMVLYHNANTPGDLEGGC